MEKVRIGIVGVGNMGSGHSRYLTAGDVPDGELVAVADTNPDRIDWAKENLGEKVQCFETAEDLFKSGSVDAVIIATPHYFHPPLAIKAMEHGLHVLIEKPAGVYTKQVRELNAVAQKSDRVFGLMFNQRTLSSHQKMKDLVQSGELGEIQRTNYIITDWFRSQSYYDSGGWRATWAGEGGGVLMNQCPHNLDLWQWICGKPSRVRAFIGFGKYHNIEVDDSVTAYVEYENGATGVFITTTGEAPGTNRLEVAGDRGKVVLENKKITFWRTRESVSKFNKEYKGGFGSPEVWKCDIPAGSGGEGHKGITKNWCDAIRNGADLLAPGEEGINGLEIANAMLLSSWTDDWVNIPFDDDLYHQKLQEKIASSTISKDSGGGQVLEVAGTH
jgi:predicted dehydrogenase